MDEKDTARQLSDSETLEPQKNKVDKTDYFADLRNETPEWWAAMRLKMYGPRAEPEKSVESTEEAKPPEPQWKKHPAEDFYRAFAAREDRAAILASIPPMMYLPDTNQASSIPNEQVSLPTSTEPPKDPRGPNSTDAPPWQKRLFPADGEQRLLFPEQDED